MSLKRFQAIVKFLHFDDTNTRAERRWNPNRTSMASKCGQSLTADSELHYVLNSQVYLGKVGLNPEVGQGQRVVEELSWIYYSSGRNIACDNFFTFIPLAKSLLQKN